MSDDHSFLAYLWGRKEVKRHLEVILTRKHRRNGLGRHLLRRAAMTGKPVEYRRGQIRILIKRVGIAGIFYFDVVCVEGRAECQKLLSARAKFEDNRVKVPLGERSKLNWWIVKKPPVAVPQVVRLRRHLKNTPVTCLKAFTAIARATKQSVDLIRRHLVEAWQKALAEQEAPYGTLVLSYTYGTCFHFRIELAAGSRLLHADTVVAGVYTTNDNRAPVYRRFRASLKKLCGIGGNSDDRTTRIAVRKHREAIKRKLAA